MSIETGFEEKKKVVLIVDDDRPIRESVRDALTCEGYEVITAENGEVGLEKLKLHHPSLILLDTRMPIVDGWEFKKEMEQDPDVADIPVFVFSALPTSPPGINATGFITKPIDLDILLNTLKPYLN